MFIPLIFQGRFAQQGAEGIHDEAPARPEDERSHCHTHDAVDDVPARNAAEDGGEQDSTGGQHVVAAVGGGGQQRFGSDALAHRAVEAAHPELDGDGNGQHPKAEPAENDRRGVQDFADGLFAQRKADGKDGHADHQPGEVLVAGVAVGVLRIRGLGGQPEADEADDVGRSVREVVQRIGHDGDGAKQGAHRQLADAEQDIASHPHKAGQVAVSGADRRVLGVGGMLDEQADQKLGHTDFS